MKDVVIRRAVSDDYSQACVLFEAGDRLHREHLPWMFEAPAGPPKSEALFRELLRDEDAAVFVASAGRLVGIAHGALKSAPDLSVFVRQRWGVLDELVVDPEWRRRGIGRALTRAFETWALDAGAAWIELNVYDFNQDARSFYESLGYLPLSRKLRKPRPDAT